MSRAIVPSEFPSLPEGATGWARSLRRPGSMYHAHALGMTVCGSVVLYRNDAHEADNLGQLQHFGVCPRCFSKVKP